MNTNKLKLFIIKINIKLFVFFSILSYLLYLLCEKLTMSFILIFQFINYIM